MALLEFSGYALRSSYAYEGNILEKIFGVRNFSLGMTIFSPSIFPRGTGSWTRFTNVS